MYRNNKYCVKSHSNFEKIEKNYYNIAYCDCCIEKCYQCLDIIIIICLKYKPIKVK